MNSIIYNNSNNDFGLTAFSSPNKRKQLEERDDDIIVTPSSSYSDSDSDADTRDTESFLSTPCPAAGSPLKRRRTMSMPNHSQFSPPLMPRCKYPVLDFLEDSSSSQLNRDLSFLAIPTPPSKANDTDTDSDMIPSFDLSPRTTLAPHFPELMSSRLHFRVLNHTQKNHAERSRRTLLPSLRMRPTCSQKHRFGAKQLMTELSLPTLADVTIQESRQVRRSSLPAVAA